MFTYFVINLGIIENVGINKNFKCSMFKGSSKIVNGLKKSQSNPDFFLKNNPIIEQKNFKPPILSLTNVKNQDINNEELVNETNKEKLLDDLKCDIDKKILKKLISPRDIVSDVNKIKELNTNIKYKALKEYKFKEDSNESLNLINDFNINIMQKNDYGLFAKVIKLPQKITRVLHSLENVEG